MTRKLKIDAANAPPPIGDNSAAPTVDPSSPARDTPDSNSDAGAGQFLCGVN
jgi:hypothetical protein